MEASSVQAQKPRPDHSLGEIPCRRLDLPAWEQEAIARPGLACVCGARGSHLPSTPDSPAAPSWARDPRRVAHVSYRGIVVLPLAASKPGLRLSPPRRRAPRSARRRRRPGRDPAAAAPARARTRSRGLRGRGGDPGGRAGEEAGLRPRPQARFRRARRGPWEAWPAGAGAAQPGTFRNCRRGRRRESPSRGGRSAGSRAEAEPPRRAAAAEPQPEPSFRQPAR